MEQPRGIETEHTLAIALEKGGLHGVGHAREHIFFRAHAQAINEEVDFLSFQRLVHHVLHAHHFAIHLQAGETLLQVDGQLLLQRTPRPDPQGSQNGEARARRITQGAVDYILHGVAFHLLTAHR